jgi:hypothetical protein
LILSFKVRILARQALGNQAPGSIRSHSSLTSVNSTEPKADAEKDKDGNAPLQARQSVITRIGGSDRWEYQPSFEPNAAAGFN